MGSPLAPALAVRILVVDDNHHFAASVQEMAERLGWSAQSVGSIQEALEETECVDYLVAVVGQRLADGRGTDLLERLVQRDPHPLVVMVAAHGTLETATKAINTGAFALVARDSRPEELAGTLERAVDNALLQRDNQRLRRIQDAIYGAIPELLIVVDDDLAIQSVNRSHPLFCRSEPAIAAGKPLEAEMDSRVRAALPWREILDEPGTEHALTLAGENGSPRFFGIASVPVPAERPLVLLRIAEVTALRKLEQRLAESESLAALGQMAGTVAHKVRNPIAGIRALTQLLRKRLPAQGSAREDAEAIVQLTDRVECVVADLLEFARREEMPGTPVDVLKLLEEVVIQARAWPSGRHHWVELEAPPGLSLEVRARAHRLQAAVRHLVENAVDASPEGGRVLVRLDASEGSCRIRIEDSGPGIPPESRQKVLQPFYTEKTEGTGLGLAIVKKVVDASGGSIRIGESATLGGACLEILLPLEHRSD